MATATGPTVGFDHFTGARVWRRLVTFSNSYPTGGEPLTNQLLGITGTIVDMVATATTATAGAVAEVIWNDATGKLQALGTTGEIANATNLSGVTVKLLIFTIQ